jgi:putative protein-disulfide isomerase
MTADATTASTATSACDVTGCPTSLEAGRGASSDRQTAAKAQLLYVTDPLCSGCWAFEPAWRRLLYRYRDELSITYVYGGLLSSWDGFNDRSAGISAPADVAPHWDIVARASGQPIDSRVWLTDPPGSSFPASIAAAAVRLLAPEQEGRYLRRLRELVFLERRNIARPAVLRQALAAIGVDSDRWQAMIDTGAAERVFEADRALARRLGVRVLPTLFVEKAFVHPRVVAAGSLAPEALEQAVLEAAATPLAPSQASRRAAAVLDAYQSGTGAELAAALGLAVPAAERELMRTGARRRTVANGTVWGR